MEKFCSQMTPDSPDVIILIIMVKVLYFRNVTCKIAKL